VTAMRLACIVLVLVVTAAPRAARADDAAPRPWSLELGLHAGSTPLGQRAASALLLGVGARGAWFLRDSPIAIDAALDASLLDADCDGGIPPVVSCDGSRLRALVGVRASTAPQGRMVGFARATVGVELLRIVVVTVDGDYEDPFASTTRDVDVDLGPGVELAAGFMRGRSTGRVGLEIAANLGLHEQPDGSSDATDYITIGVELRLVVAFGR
jgi:hypothetical protein